jgi:glutamyl-tRNA reductase
VEYFGFELEREIEAVEVFPEELRGRARRLVAEALAREEAERLNRWLRFRAVSPAIAELRTYAETVRTNELRRSASRLRGLTPDQIAAVEALTSGIVNKLMHGPTIALREAAVVSATAESGQAVLDVLRLDRARHVSTHGR